MPSYATFQVINLLAATTQFAFTLSLSLVSIPLILESPSPILAIRQWEIQFTRGRGAMTPLYAMQLMLSVLLISKTDSQTTGSAYTSLRVLYYLSTILAFTILPFTLYYIQPINKHLLQRATEQRQLHYADLPEKSAGMQTAKEHEKIENWGWFNWWRIAALLIIVLMNAAAIATRL